MKLQIFFHAIDVLENIINDARHDSMQVWVTHDTFHRVSFTRRCLSIRKYGAIVAIEHICKSGNTC